MCKLHFPIWITICWFMFVGKVATAQEASPPPATHSEAKRPKIGLVLSGGGAKGLAHIGVLKVLEEAGIQPDFIGGSSMGSIIGGLYAMGYSCDFIEQMVKEQDWNRLIYDKFDRNNLNISEKGTDESFFINFPLQHKKFTMPSGVIEAQEISWLLSRLCTPVYHIRDFNQLQTPFLCIGTNIKTGKQEIFDQGNLALAMRASMAIPGFFTSIEYQGDRIVDGGVVNNYPAPEVRAMGADIIIGSDVQFLSTSDEELESMVGSIMQIINYHSEEAQQKAEEATDFYIHPDIDQYGILSFNEADSLIALGAAKARQFLPQLKALADSLNQIEPQPTKKHDLQPLDEIYIQSVEYLGLNRLKTKMLDGYKPFKTPGKVRITDIDRWIRSLHGTKFLASIRYELVPVTENHAILRLTIKENSSRILSASLHFDTDYRTAVNLKASFRNWLLPESKANLILALGDNIKIRGDYWINWGLIPGPGLALDFNVVNFYRYEAQQRTSEMRVTDLQITPFVRSIYRSYIELELEAQLEYSGTHAVTSYLPIERADNITLNGVFKARLDTRNQLHYPNKGTYINLNIKTIQSLQNSVPLYWFGAIDFNTSFRFSPIFTLRPTLAAVVSSKTSLPALHPQYQALMGGYSKYNGIDGAIPFIGLNNLQLSGNLGYRVGLELQFNLYRNKHFVVGTINMGDIENDFKNYLNFKDEIFGMGITYAYNSIIGPLSLTMMGGNNLNFGLFLNIGFRL